MRTPPSHNPSASEQVAAASAGKPPGALDAVEIAAWGFALRLATTPGPFEIKTLGSGEELFGD